MEFFSAAADFPFLRHALAAGVLAGIACGADRDGQRDAAKERQVQFPRRCLDLAREEAARARSMPADFERAPLGWIG